MFLGYSISRACFKVPMALKYLSNWLVKCGFCNSCMLWSLTQMVSWSWKLGLIASHNVYIHCLHQIGWLLQNADIINRLTKFSFKLGYQILLNWHVFKMHVRHMYFRLGLKKILPTQFRKFFCLLIVNKYNYATLSEVFKVVNSS